MQVIILIIEVLVGVVTGQQGLALIAQLDSLDAIQRRYNDDVDTLVTSGKVCDPPLADAHLIKLHALR